MPNSIKIMLKKTNQGLKDSSLTTRVVFRNNQVHYVHQKNTKIQKRV